MLSLPRLGASWPPSFQLLGKLPGQCLICRRWQASSLCTHCLEAWRAPVARCQRCAIDLPAYRADAGHEICALCEDQSPEVDRTICAVHYTAPWSPLLARLKFRDGTALARPLGALLAQAVAPRLSDVNLIVPVPLSRQRLAERGYNQSWLLARQVGKRLKVEARHDLLERRTHTSRLMAMSAEERQRHIAGAFEVTTTGLRLVPGRDVAIVDDVMTTGATLNAAAATLLDAGAHSVSAWVVARTPSPAKKAKGA
ncbi:MAG: phosphoribosyltransferase family protein [Aquabacterium sp.]